MRDVHSLGYLVSSRSISRGRHTCQGESFCHSPRQNRVVPAVASRFSGMRGRVHQRLSDARSKQGVLARPLRRSSSHELRRIYAGTLIAKEPPQPTKAQITFLVDHHYFQVSQVLERNEVFDFPQGELQKNVITLPKMPNDQSRGT